MMVVTMMMQDNNGGDVMHDDAKTMIDNDMMVE